MILQLAHLLFGSIVGLEMQVVLPRNQDHVGYAFSGSFFTDLPIAYGMIENGVIIKPETSDPTVNNYAATSYGYYLGYTFLPDFRMIRPGMFVGMAYDKEIDRGAGSWALNPFYGVKAQLSLLSFSLSSRGLGFGLNFPVNLQ